MDKTKTAAGKSPAQTPKPVTADERIEKALKDIEEMNKALEARQKALDEKEKELNEKADKINKDRVPTAAETKSYQTKAQKMKEYLWSQPKVTIMIPLEQGEKEGTTLPVTLNGYRLNIRKNTYVEVPKPVADLLMDILKQNEAAGRDFRMDLPRPAKDGVSISDALM